MICRVSIQLNPTLQETMDTVAYEKRYRRLLITFLVYRDSPCYQKSFYNVFFIVIIDAIIKYKTIAYIRCYKNIL